MDEPNDQTPEFRTGHMAKLVAVASFADSDSANVAKLELEAEEIPCFLDNDNTNTALWYMQPAIGGVKLLVPEQFAEDARELLGQAASHDGTDDAMAQDRPGGEADGPQTVIICPYCHSTDTDPLSWQLRIAQAIIIILLSVSLTIVHPWLLACGIGFAVYFLLTKPDYRCLHCRRRWNP